MARKSLSDQVIEEVDRARGLLKPVQDIVDPMTSHMVGAVLESLHRIETMCIAAKQRAVNSVLAEEWPALGDTEAYAVDPKPRRRSATHKAESRKAGF